MITYSHFPNDFQFAVPTGARPFRCILLIERRVPEPERKAICHAVIAAGCLYAMIWGRDCELWHDDLDVAALNQFDDRTVPDSRLVVTTWHSKETLEELLHFAKYTARHSYAGEDLVDLVVLDLGPESRLAEVCALYERA